MTLYLSLLEMCVTQDIKAPSENKAADPASSELGLPGSFFLSLSLSLSLSLFSV